MEKKHYVIIGVIALICCVASLIGVMLLLLQQEQIESEWQGDNSMQIATEEISVDEVEYVEDTRVDGEEDIRYIQEDMSSEEFERLANGEYNQPMSSVDETVAVDKAIAEYYEQQEAMENTTTETSSEEDADTLTIE